MRTKPRTQPTSLELFTGAGGLALGVAEAGFSHRAVVEYNRDACASLRENSRRIEAMRDWSVHEGDARKYPFEQYLGQIDLIAAGAPCQPFSLGGKHRGHADDRNLFPVVFKAVREIRPKVVLVENVKGLLRSSFREYFDYIELQLRNPHCAAEPGEDWRDHARRLRELDGSAPPEDRYDVDHLLLNAADFGVPQKRERVFIVGFRGDLGVDWTTDFASLIRPTHSERALLYAKWVSGDYWRDHGIPEDQIPEPIPARLLDRLPELEGAGPGGLRRWRTVRDALRMDDPEAGWVRLPEPRDREEHPEIANHVGNPGARSYKGHTGSWWDEPAKTLKAGDHGVPGGENMVRLLHDDPTAVRYFTVREAARLQGFPDEYRFRGAWSEGFRQLGNAVPVGLARVVAGAVGKVLDGRATHAVTARQLARL